MTSRALFGNPDSEIDHEFGERLMKKDPKTAVNQFCQRFCNRPINKEDVIYTVTKYPQGYQATVKLNCIEGQEFAGEVSNSSKEAEAHASQQILDFYAEQINNMRKPPKKKKKRPATQPPGTPPPPPPKPGDPQPELDPSISAKGNLNAHVGKILRRVLEKDEVLYETQQVVGGYQSTVRMPGLPDDWGLQIWAGEVCHKRQDAEQSVAAIALEAIRADPELMAAFNAPQKPKNWSPCGSKGKGKGGVMKGGKGLQVAANAANQWNAAAMGMGGWGF
mmetsp:Transcript_71153/g.192368  ORF Transcript_71153/g.192368 Transcript_71153/m.192368 type:complete len:277 (+) Transcript_71153:160-990(+)